MTKIISKHSNDNLAAYKPTLGQFASVIGTSPRWVSELRSRGVMPANGATLAEYVQAWGAHLISTQAPGDADDLEAARTRLANAQAEAIERKNAIDRGELAPRADMISAGVGVITMATARLQQVGAQVAQGDTKLRKRIETAINDVLTDLSMTRIEEAVGGGLDDAQDGEHDG